MLEPQLEAEQEFALLVLEAAADGSLLLATRISFGSSCRSSSPRWNELHSSLRKQVSDRVLWANKCILENEPQVREGWNSTTLIKPRKTAAVQ